MVTWIILKNTVIIMVFIEDVRCSRFEDETKAGLSIPKRGNSCLNTQVNQALIMFQNLLIDGDPS